MPLPNLPVPKFPNVPPLPGVPPILRDANATVANVVVGLQQAKALLGKILGLTPGPEWGIFDEDGAPVITGQSVVRFSFAKEQKVSDFPIEDGGFRSYNKVDTPADCKITFAVQGGKARAEFLRNIAAQVNLLALVTVITPDRSYPSMNVVHYDYDRTAEHGFDLLEIDVWLREIREAPAAEFTATQEPSGATPASNGTVQATPVPAAVAQERALKASGEVAP